MTILLETCARELESHIKGLFKHPRMLTKTLAEVPVVGGVFIPDLTEDYTPLLLQVCKALCCRERFQQDAPGWPTLPLHEDICGALKDDDDPRCRVLGLYGSSLSLADWDYEAHPPFGSYVSGLMAYKHTPIEVRADPQLLAEFPPLPLAGLTDGKLYWRSPERITEDRQYSAWVYEMDARREAGATMQAFDEWTRE